MTAPLASIAWATVLAAVVLGSCVGLFVLELRLITRQPELISLNLREEPGDTPTPAVIYEDAA